MKIDDLDRLLAADAPEPGPDFDDRVIAALAGADRPTLDDLLDADRPEPGPDFDDRVIAALAGADRPTLDDLLDADRPEPGLGFDDRVIAALADADRPMLDDLLDADRPEPSAAFDARVAAELSRAGDAAGSAAPTSSRILRFPSRRAWPVIGAVVAVAAALALWVMPAGPREAVQPDAGDLAFLDEMELLEVYDEMQVFDGITDDETFELVAALHTIDEKEALP